MAWFGGFLFGVDLWTTLDSYYQLGRRYDTVGGLIRAGVTAGVFVEPDVARLTLLWSATGQGTSALVTSRRVTIEQAGAVIDDAITLFLSGSPA